MEKYNHNHSLTATTVPNSRSDYHQDEYKAEFNRETNNKSDIRDFIDSSNYKEKVEKWLRENFGIEKCFFESDVAPKKTVIETESICSVDTEQYIKSNRPRTTNKKTKTIIRQYMSATQIAPENMSNKFCENVIPTVDLTCISVSSEESKANVNDQLDNKDFKQQSKVKQSVNKLVYGNDINLPKVDFKVETVTSLLKYEIPPIEVSQCSENLNKLEKVLKMHAVHLINGSDDHNFEASLFDVADPRLDYESIKQNKESRDVALKETKRISKYNYERQKKSTKIVISRTSCDNVNSVSQKSTSLDNTKDGILSNISIKSKKSNDIKGMIRKRTNDCTNLLDSTETVIKKSVPNTITRTKELISQKNVKTNRDRKHLKIADVPSTSAGADKSTEKEVLSTSSNGATDDDILLTAYRTPIFVTCLVVPQILSLGIRS